MHFTIGHPVTIGTNKSISIPLLTCKSSDPTFAANFFGQERGRPTRHDFSTIMIGTGKPRLFRNPIHRIHNSLTINRSTSNLGLCFHWTKVFFILSIDFSFQNFSNRSNKNNQLDTRFETQYFSATSHDRVAQGRRLSTSVAGLRSRATSVRPRLAKLSKRRFNFAHTIFSRVFASSVGCASVFGAECSFGLSGRARFHSHRQHCPGEARGREAARSAASAYAIDVGATANRRTS
jgi:hypothetical protein